MALITSRMTTDYVMSMVNALCREYLIEKGLIVGGIYAESYSHNVVVGDTISIRGYAAITEGMELQQFHITPIVLPGNPHSLTPFSSENIRSHLDKMIESLWSQVSIG